MVARKVWTSFSVRPMPVSVTDSSSSARTVIRAGASGSRARRAEIASTAFCSSSRR